MRNRFKALVLLAGLALLAGSEQSWAQADDTALFSTLVPPNVMLLVDNSGSMTHMVWHPAYDDSATPTCGAYSNGSTYWASGNFTTTQCGKTLTVYIDPNVAGGWVRFSGRYLNWLFSPESNAYNADIQAASNGTYSSCIGGGTYSKYRRARVTAAKDVLREVVCQVNAAGAVRFGMAQFRRPGAGSHTDGGYVRVPADDFLDASQNPNVYTLNGNTQSHGDHIDDAIDELTGESWTPLAESLFQVYTYFMSRNTSDIPLGANLPATQFPKYSYTTSRTAGDGGPFSSSGAPTVPESPVQWECQKNFVLIITDGEPTKDLFTGDGSSEEQGFANFMNLIGDYNPDGENELTVPWGGDGSRYLDDVAMFMNRNDFRPDMTDDQTIDVYTVGFSTSPDANSVLQKTAQVGGGQFYYSTSAEDLAQDIVSILTDIIRKSHTFTASAVPATRTADGGMFYTSSFIPERDSGYWTGSLRAWKMLANGDILGQGDICALDDPDPGECNSGEFLGSAIPFWEAADNVPAPASRNLHTSVLTGTGTSTMRPFKHQLLTSSPANEVTAAHLGVTFPPPVTPAGSVATTADELTGEIVANVRGCRFGTGANGVACIPRNHLLGDIFHSAPVVIPAPRGFQNELSYKQFASNFSDRDRIVVAGSNDGFLRFFEGGYLDTNLNPPRYTVGTGVELFGFMPYGARQNVRELPTDDNARDFYFVDGTPSIADVWLPSAVDGRQVTKSSNEWMTMMVGGLRQGGRSYYAMDVTDPSSSSYPGYLWEWPREDAPASIADYQGESWSEPIITKIRVRVNSDDNNGEGYERWVAIIGGGYDEKSDPNSHATYDPAHLGGRSIVVLDLRSGEILARKKFDPSTSASQEEQDMLYAIPSRPAVYDTDFDGYADLIYIGDLGGNVWKWVIKEIADDIVNGSVGDEDQDANWHFKKFFSAPVYDSGTNFYYKSFYHAPSGTIKSGTLWLAFGSGERSNLPFAGFSSTQDENNRFYSMTDLDPFEKRRFTVPLPTPYPTLGEVDLVDHTDDVTCMDLSNYRGFYFRGREGEKWITQSEIFAYYVLVLSYLPTPPASPCEAGGEAWLYTFKVHCGEGYSNGSTTETRQKIDGKPPVDPKISIGDDANVLIRHETKFKFTKPKISGQALWRELPN